jgi:UDP-N-acetylmuramoylalanine--D-glutamate ligase
MIDINKIPTDFKGKKIAVLGAARSGISASLLLAKQGANVLLSDIKNVKISKQDLEELINNKIEIELREHSSKVYQSDLVIVSPGIPNTAPIVERIEALSIPIVSESEAAYWFSQPCEIVAITGSNGKTTTTTLIFELLKNSNLDVYCGGNIGTPFSKLILKSEKSISKKKVFVLEVSSFQLERIFHFHPYISVILNISQDHLDRHGDIHSYLSTKLKIAMNQTPSDYFIYNEDDRLISQNLPRNCTAIPFGLLSTTEKPIKATRDAIYLNNTELIRRTDIRLFGEHNLYNIMSALNVTLFYNIPAEKIRNTLKNFKSIEHRLEYVTTIDGVDYYNDSKATNVDSVIWALKSFEKPIVIILGGKDKNSNFSPLIPEIKKHAKSALLIGEAAPKIKKVLNRVIPLYEENSLQEAVKTAKKLSNKGDIVLLSPSCASFDMFENFEHRGKVFKQIVLSLKGEQ